MEFNKLEQRAISSLMKEDFLYDNQDYNTFSDVLKSNVTFKKSPSEQQQKSPSKSAPTKSKLQKNISWRLNLPVNAGKNISNFSFETFQPLELPKVGMVCHPMKECISQRQFQFNESQNNYQQYQERITSARKVKGSKRQFEFVTKPETQQLNSIKRMESARQFSQPGGVYNIFDIDTPYTRNLKNINPFFRIIQKLKNYEKKHANKDNPYASLTSYVNVVKTQVARKHLLFNQKQFVKQTNLQTQVVQRKFTDKGRVPVLKYKEQKEVKKPVEMLIIKQCQLED